MLISENGVLLSFTEVTEDSVVQVKTAQGDFGFKLADVPHGKIVGELEDAVEVERTASAAVLTDEKTDDDYPPPVKPPATCWSPPPV